MPYKLYRDKNENFECEVEVKNASLKNSLARLVVQFDDNINLVFEGKIENGKCVIPIRRLKGILEENSKGKIHLEVIVEDTYFKPWENHFVVSDYTSVKVKVNEEKQPNKPLVEVKFTSPKTPISKLVKSNVTPIRELIELCRMFNVTKKTISKKRIEFSQILKEYFVSNPENQRNRCIIVNEVVKLL